MRRFLWLLAFPLLLWGRDWLVMVYMAADNDMAVLADSDLAEMERVGSSDEVSIVVQVDKPYTGGRRLGVLRDTCVVFEDLGIIDMCDWQTLAEFMEWGIRNWPADRYLVVLWDHGTGWTAQPRRSFGSDYSSGRQMSIADGDLQRAFDALAGLTGEKIDLLAFDACAMQQVEIGYEVRQYAKVFLAPQGLWPLQGFPYDEVLQAIREDPGIGETGLAARIVTIGRDRYAGIQPVALGAVRLDRFERLAGGWRDLAERLMAGAPAAAWPGLRAGTQTIPEGLPVPDSTDDYVDLGDLLERMQAAAIAPGAGELLDDYRSCVVQAAYWGDSFSRTSGLTAWFPLRYERFKQLAGLYLNLDWSASGWPNFLNWFYQADDIRPSAVQLTCGAPGGENDFRLDWGRSWDLARVDYRIVACAETAVVFQDGAEDTSGWDLNGFSLVTSNHHSGARSLHSGNVINLDNFAASRSSIAVKGPGILDVYLSYQTQDRVDSLIIEYGPFRDVHYGYSAGWQRRRTILPAGDHPLVFRYRTDASTNLGGCFIDDITVLDLAGGRFVRQGLADTTLYLYNQLRGRHRFAVQPVDRYGNAGELSGFGTVTLDLYTRPFALPNPFQDGCELVLDYPDSLAPVTRIFSVSGRRVRTFDASAVSGRRIRWDGRDEQGRACGAGLYFVVVEAGGFKRIGKIARQR